MTKALRTSAEEGAVDGPTVYTHLKGHDTELLAVLALKVALDVLGKEATPSISELSSNRPGYRD